MGFPPAFYPSTVNRFLKLYAEYGFSGLDFIPPVNSLEDKYYNLVFFYKKNMAYRFSLTMVRTGNSNQVNGRIVYNPPSYDTPDIVRDSEYDLINDTLEQFKIWLRILKTELEAEEENEFILNPLFQSFSESDMDKPFTAFQKELFLKGIKNYIDKISVSKIEEKKKRLLIFIAEESKIELENVSPGDTKLSKKSWLRKFAAKVGVVVGWVSLAAVGGIIEGASWDYVKEKLSQQEEFTKQEQAEVYHITVQSFHFNYTNVFNYQDNSTTILLPSSQSPGK